MTGRLASYEQLIMDLLISVVVHRSVEWVVAVEWESAGSFED